MGPKRQPGTAANLVAGQAAGPLEKPVASQNCPRPYQGESGGLEPSTNLVAGQAAAPRGRGPSAEGPPLRGRSALTGGPVPPCAPLPSGGLFCLLRSASLYLRLAFSVRILFRLCHG